MLKKCSRFQKPDLTKQSASHEKQTLQNETTCLPNFDQNHETSFSGVSKFDTKLFEQKA